MHCQSAVQEKMQPTASCSRLSNKTTTPTMPSMRSLLAHLPHVVLAVAVQPFANCSCIVHRMNPSPLLLPFPPATAAKGSNQRPRNKTPCAAKAKKPKTSSVFFSAIRQSYRLAAVCVCEREKHVEGGMGTGVRGRSKGSLFQKIANAKFHLCSVRVAWRAQRGLCPIPTFLCLFLSRPLPRSPIRWCVCILDLPLSLLGWSWHGGPTKQFFRNEMSCASSAIACTMADGGLAREANKRGWRAGEGVCPSAAGNGCKMSMALD